MSKTLIVKLGALGDVVRTTVLLPELEGEIYWLTRNNARDLLNSDRIKRVFSIEEPNEITELKEHEYDLVISLDEEKDVLKVTDSVEKKKLIGAYLDQDGNVDYTKDSSDWFDMSLVSKLGKEKADEMKLKNVKSVPQILIEMIGKRWKGQEYHLGVSPRSEGEVRGRVGLIDVSTGVWPNKKWAGYKKLAARLKKDGLDVIFLGIRDSLRQHVDDINGCELIVCGDTLGMHIALALKKRVVAIFNCTPPQEIYSYGRLTKIVSPLWEEYMYKKTHDERATRAAKVDDVYQAVSDSQKSE